MSAYNIILSDGTQSILIPPRQVSENLASIPLVGRELSGYGNIIATAQLRMLENFASATSPDDPLVGQLWYDKNTEEIKVYDTSEQWVTVAEPPPEELDDLTDVNLTSPSQGQFLRYLSGEWQNTTFTLDFTDLTDTPSNRVRNSFLRVNESGTALTWVSGIPTSTIEGVFPLSLLPLQDICDWLKENCVQAPAPPVAPPPTGEASVSGNHIGQSCSVQLPGSCSASGILTATITNPQFTTPPYTYTWERVSGSQLDGGASIQISSTSNTTVSIGTAMTRAATVIGDNIFTSRYSIRVTDNSSPPKTLFAEIPSTTYNIVGTSAPAPTTYNVRVGTTSYPLGTGISIASGYEGFLGAGVFREAGQTIEIGFAITNPNFDFDSFTSSVGLSESIVTGPSNTRIVTFTMPSQAVEVGFTSEQQIFELEVNVDPPGEFTVSPSIYSPGTNATKVTSVTAGTSIALVVDQTTDAILDDITSDCGGSLSPAATDPGPWTYTFTMPTNNCSVNIDGDFPPSPDGNISGGFFGNNALFGVIDAESVEAFIQLSSDGNVYKFQTNCTTAPGGGQFDPPVCTTTTAQAIGKWIVNDFPVGISASDYIVDDITAGAISGISYDPSSATIPSSGGSMASGLVFAYSNDTQNSEGVQIVVDIIAPGALVNGSITLQLSAELA